MIGYRGVRTKENLHLYLKHSDNIVPFKASWSEEMQLHVVSNHVPCVTLAHPDFYNPNNFRKGEIKKTYIYTAH